MTRKPNRSRKFNERGRKKREMPMDGAGTRNIQRVLDERAEGKKPIRRLSKKRRKKRS